jgi:DNA-binding transcriptional LysR family regulator
MNVELRDLRWAVTASQYRSLREASEVLGIRQSPLSRRLRDIEKLPGRRSVRADERGDTPDGGGPRIY